jgi:hypothetical protein
MNYFQKIKSWEIWTSINRMDLTFNGDNIYNKYTNFEFGKFRGLILDIEVSFPNPVACVFFDVHNPVHRIKSLTTKQTRCTNFWNLFLEWNSTCFGQYLCPSSGVFHCTHINGVRQQACVIYIINVCTVKNFWCWTQELSETCRVSFQE